jgi:HEPN domain-containing protein
MMQHAIEHLQNGTMKSMGFAVLHADNSIELVLKELVRSNGIRLIDKKGYSMDYYECIKKLVGKGIALPELPSIDLLHTERNNVYHLGNKPDKDKAEWLVYDVALSFLRSVCMNELHFDLSSYSKDFSLSDEIRQDIELTRSEMVNSYLVKATNSFKSSIFDSTVILSYIGIEALMRELIFAKKSSPTSTHAMIEEIRERNMLSPKSFMSLKRLREVRNNVAHGLKQANKQEAKFALDAFKAIIDEIGIPLELKCKTCGALFSSGIMMNRKSFENTVLKASKHKCPNGHVDSYNKEDYVFKL